jgi:nicotinate-nucleotide pyrophosphorylase (carboxylating)
MSTQTLHHLLHSPANAKRLLTALKRSRANRTENLTSTLIQLALDEDIGPGDLTSLAVFGKTDPNVEAKIVAKQAGVLSGIEMARASFAFVDKELAWQAFKRDGERLSAGEYVASIRGRATSVLAAERVALNVLQHLSGIATVTARYVQAVAGTRAKIYDTRKTLPGWRALAKQAVRDGGGENHRMGLYDAFLIKENHIAACGGIGTAIRACRTYRPGLFLEAEVQSLDELHEALRHGPDAVLLDNFTLDDVRAAVRIPHAPCLFEVSGGVILETVRAIAETGVERISIGALTHSPAAFDFSLLIDQAD